MKKRLLSILLTACLLMGLLPTVALAATETGIKYLDASGVEQTCSSATVVESGTTTWNVGWYVVTGNNVTIESDVTVNGDVHLILADGCKLTVNGGIQGESGASLTIYAQSTGSSMGKLTATGSAAGNKSYGIYATGGNITINGGVVTATGSSFTGTDGDSYGICANNNSAGGNITINGGVVTATGGTANFTDSGTNRESCGIYADCSLTINGGNVEAKGGIVNGAGAAENYSNGEISCGIHAHEDITISGNAVVTATASTTNFSSCGIFADSGSITISGGTVNATGGTIDGGKSQDKSCGIYAAAGVNNITISGTAQVEATGGSASGSSSYGIYAVSRVNITISGGTVTATGGSATSTAAMNIAPVLDTGMKVSNGESADNLTPLEYSSLNASTYSSPVVKVEPCGTHDWDGQWVFIDTNNHSQHCKWCGSAGNPQQHTLGSDGSCTACRVQGSRYLDENGTPQTHIASLLTGKTTTWREGWYVAQGDITINGSVTFYGNVHLILADGCDLTVNGGIKGQWNATLTIYAQSTGSSMGKLTATGSDSPGNESAGIRVSGGSLTINGGAVTVTCGEAAPSVGIQAYVLFVKLREGRLVKFCEENAA